MPMQKVFSMITFQTSNSLYCFELCCDVCRLGLELAGIILFIVVPLSDGFIVSVNHCTASVIGDNWLLTAAHCFENEMYRTYSGAMKSESMFGDAVLDLSLIHI